MKYDPACLFPSGQHPKAEPLLDLYELQGLSARKGLTDYASGLSEAIRMVEAKIATGELMVVRTAKNTSLEFSCSSCKFTLADAFQLPADEYDKPWNYCPGCGAKIIP